MCTGVGNDTFIAGLSLLITWNVGCGEQEDNRRDMIRLLLQSGEQFDGSSNGDEQFKIHLESPCGQ